MNVNFYYGVQGGWIHCGLTVGYTSVLHPVNGWHDGPVEVILATCEMFGGTSEAVAYFQEEPGEYRWRISRLAANRVRVRVIEFDDWALGLPDEDGTLLFDRTCAVMSIARAVYDGCEEWLARHEGPRAEREMLGDILRRYDYSQPRGHDRA